MTADADVVIVGAGLAGLSAAVHLHRAGVATTVCEAADDVGGRVRTDRRDGFLLDRGFQVLLPAYPELRRQADMSALRPRAFLRGVLAVTTESRSWLAAPWYGAQTLAGAAGFLLGHPHDSAALAALSLRDMLAPGPLIRAADPAATTLEDLRRRFSAAVTAEVFRPFLAGVFLDPSLGTPARLFHLIWRCFLRGGGALPEGGMQMLPRQLADNLPAGTVRTGTQITEVTGNGVRTKAGEHIRATAVVIATDGASAATLAPMMTAPAWHPVTTFYYRLPASPLCAPVLVVDGHDELLLNAAVLSDVVPGYAPHGVALAAASVPGRADPSLEPQVRGRLTRMYEASTRDWEFLDAYAIPCALPVLQAGQPRPDRSGSVEASTSAEIIAIRHRFRAHWCPDAGPPTPFWPTCTAEAINAADNTARLEFRAKPPRDNPWADVSSRLADAGQLTVDDHAACACSAAGASPAGLRRGCSTQGIRPDGARRMITIYPTLADALRARQDIPVDPAVGLGGPCTVCACHPARSPLLRTPRQRPRLYSAVPVIPAVGAGRALVIEDDAAPPQRTLLCVHRWFPAMVPESPFRVPKKAI